MRQEGARLVPTLGAPRGLLEPTDEHDRISDTVIEKAKELIWRYQESFRLAVDAGVRIAIGSDVGVVPHGSSSPSPLISRKENLWRIPQGGCRPGWNRAPMRWPLWWRSW